MHRTMKLVSTVGLTLILALGGAGAASAHNNGAPYCSAPNCYASNTHSYPDGGEMWYGVHENVNGCCKANDASYNHPTRKHRSSVQNGGGLVRSGDMSAGIWAQATQAATSSGNQAYYFIY